jgi:hypothetical protein
MIRNFTICKPHHYYLGDLIKEEETGWAYGRYGVVGKGTPVLVGKPEGNGPH